MVNEKKERILSVITPCREVQLPLVSHLLQSLEQQTFGFEKIEWILVVHNSGSEYLRQVEDLVAPYPNIRLYKLQNEFHTASSPKNYAMGKARCEYITFLDADDALTSDCLEKALSYFSDELDGVFFNYLTIREEDQERLKITRSRDFEGNDVQYMDCDKCDPDFMLGGELTVTGKIYRRSVLEDNHIRFDVEVPIAEDVYFNLYFFRHGRRFCLLPELKGYLYYLRGDSVVQDFAGKTPEQVILAGKGFARILDYGISHGLFMDNILLDLIGYQSAMMLACTSLTMDQRKELRQLYLPFIDRLKEVSPSGCYDKKLLRTIKLLPKVVIMRPGLMNGVSALIRFLRIDMNKKIRQISKD